MEKYFNIAGPCYHEEHYMVPILERNKAILPLINQKHYFVIHAARQSGKTTLLQHLVDYIEQGDKFYALYCSLEAAKDFSDPKEGIPAVFDILEFAVEYSPLPNNENFGKGLDRNKTSTLIKKALTNFCKALDRPLVLFLDEIDSLKNGTLISLITQLRDGYITQKRIPFPASVALVGMRNIRDYKGKIRPQRATLGSASPFNIITKALTLKNFTFEEVEILYEQHTVATGQKFSKDVIEKIYAETQGQPWLVNAIPREVIVELLENDFSKKITLDLVDKAIKNIILRRDTHIDSLLERLKEDRVRRVIEPIITGKKYTIDFTNDHTQYCIDLGLIHVNKEGNLEPSNQIYKEVIIRYLTANTQFHLQSIIKNRWIQPDGSLDMTSLLKAFQQFWRENSGIWEEKYQYKEAAPHLILMAYLQTVINSGGKVRREYASNKDRLDLYVQFGKFKYPIEIKIRYDTKTVGKGLIQIQKYMDAVGENVGWLIVFDKRKDTSWDDKITWATKLINGKTIHVVGC